MIRLCRKLIPILLLLTLVGCSTSQIQTQKSTTTVSPLRTPTATPLPSGTVLYQSNWSQGLAAWGNPTGWKIVNGMAQSNLSDNNALNVPYLPVVPNYAIEVRFQIVSVPTDGGFFTVTAEQHPGKDGYDAGILNLLSPASHNEFANPQVQVYLEPMDDMSAPMAPADYEPGTTWNTLRIQVQGGNVRMLINGSGKGAATSVQYNVLSNGPLQVISSGAVINVSDIRVMTL